jgi:hypothetical protein
MQPAHAALWIARVPAPPKMTIDDQNPLTAIS